MNPRKQAARQGITAVGVYASEELVSLADAEEVHRHLDAIRHLLGMDVEKFDAETDEFGHDESDQT